MRRGGLLPIAAAKDWPGYLGSPRLASAAHGAKVVDRVAEKAVVAVLKILDGASVTAIPRAPARAIFIA